MASTALIVGGLAAGGLLAYVLYKKLSAPKPPPGSDCKALCDANLSGDAKTACELACAAGDLVGDIPNPFHDSAGDAEGAISHGDADNKKLNGDVELKLASQLQFQSSPNQRGNGIRTMTGTVLRFKNGCVPFKGAAGFSKCAKGTHSMWINEDDIDIDDAYIHGAIPAFANDALATTYMDEHDTGAALDDVTKSQAMKGTVSLEHPDPTTQGPFDPGDYLFWTRENQPAPAGYKTLSNGNAYQTIPQGKQGWYFRGEPLLCDYGSAPDLWDENGNPRVLPADFEPVCVPSGRAYGTGGPGSGSSGGQSTYTPGTETPCETMNSDPHMTWISPGDVVAYTDGGGHHHSGTVATGYWAPCCGAPIAQPYTVNGQTPTKKLNPMCGQTAPTQPKGPVGSATAPGGTATSSSSPTTSSATAPADPTDGIIHGGAPAATYAAPRAPAPSLRMTRNVFG